MSENPFEREPVLVTIHQEGLFSEPTFSVSKSDYDKLKGENDQLWRDVERVKVQLATCAAGPWRYDVENAPKDGSEFLIWYDDQDAGWQLRIIHWYEPFKNFRDRMDYGVYMPCMATFAVPNPPQVTTGKAFDIPEWHDNDSGGYVQ